MLSSLSRGYGSWTGDVDVHLPVSQDAGLPTVDQEHRHGITVTPRSRGTPVIIPVAENGQLNIPKTFATRKGALMLFTAPDSMPKEPRESPRPRSKRKRRHQRDVVDLSLKLKTLERLSLSVLQFGDKLYEKDTSSISDKENKLMLNFLHDLNQENDDMDLHSQPGGDYKFYLRDLKRRASCRGHGVGDTTPHRARSAELQEILDDLEQAWPRYSSSQSYRGSTSSADFLHPESPAPSTLSTRSYSRGKVLNSKKLTASLKSLSSLGRPASTEPDTRSIVSDSFMASTQYRYGGDPRRSKSSMWVSEASSPVYLNQSRPQTSHRSRSAMAQGVSEHKLLNTPEPSEYRAPDGTKSQTMWLEMENHGDVSYISDDTRSMLSGADSEYRASDRGHVMSPVKEERMSTPSRGGGDRDAMLAEAASVLSSLVEEEDIDLPDGQTNVPCKPATRVGDTTLDETDTSRWPGLTDTEDQVDAEGRRSRVSSRSKTPKFKSEAGSEVGLDSLAQPLQPPYSGPLTRENRSTSPMEIREEGFTATQEGDTPYPQSRATSAGDVYITHTDVRAESPSSTITTPIPRSDTPAALSGNADQQMSQVLTDAERQRTASALGEASLSSTDKHGQDPDTLVSVFGRQDTNDLEDKSRPPSAASPLIKSSSPLPPSSPSPPDEGAPVTAVPPSPTAPTVSTEEPPKSPSPDQQPEQLPVSEVATIEEEEKEEEQEEEEVIPEPPAPKRRERKEEQPKTPRIDEVEGEEGAEAEEGEVKEGEEAEGSTELSERVKQEMLDREERLKKQQEEKAEKEAEEARKKEEEEMKKQAAEDKRKAAEERVRLRAEELARKKEEEELLKKLAPPASVEEPNKATKGKKGKGKGGKQEAAVEEKKYTNPLNITSVQSEDGADIKGSDLLEKLKANNKDVDLPVDKIQEFMNAQVPKIKVEPEKEQVRVPDHMKEMFNRRTDSQAQEDIEEGIAKMRSAMNDALGGSILQEQENMDGLSAEEFAAAEEALKEKLKHAEEQMLGAVTSGSATKKTSPRVKKQEKKASPTRKKKGADQLAKSDLAKEREAKKEQQQLEKQKRLEEVKELQRKIAMKEDERKTKEREAKRKAEELKEDMESLRREEEELEIAEQDAREQLAAVRKAQREEREARRKTDLEKKKQDAINRREKEKAMIDQARLKEQEMLDRIADAEMARRLREEDEAKREEEEQLAQDRYEAEMKEAQRQAEEDEERLRELERQAEEEAFQRLIEEKEAAEEKRLQLEREAAKIREEEEKQRLEMLEEEKRLEEERRKHEAEEEARREEERERLRELQRLEEEAREKMRAELEKRRLWALKRREYNLEQRANLDAIRQCQGVTEPWTFSYFVRWPKESYHRPMGVDPKKKLGAPRPKPKSAAQQGSSSSQSAVDVAAVP